MKHKWLTYFVFTFFAALVFLFFILRLQPVYIPSIEHDGIIPGSVEAPVITFVNPARGPEKAPVTIIEYGDFECPHCKDMAIAIDLARAQFPNRIRHIWKHFPNEGAHPHAISAAIAAQCAHRQGAFWPFHDAVYERQSFLSDGQYTQIAKDLGIDAEAFNACFHSRDTLPIVQNDLNEALGLGLSATPTIYINGIRHVGVIAPETLILYVQEALGR